jgi:hypothetical protein
MAATKVSFGGQINGVGGLAAPFNTFDAQNALFLKVFAGEVLQTFETTTVMKDKHMIRTITSGKSAQFPVTGTATAAYHVPGQDLITDGSYVNAIKHAERLIHVDSLLTSTTFIDKLDEMKNHYDVRSIYSSELGRALANQFDKNLIGLSILAARVSSPAFTGGTIGSVLTDAAYNTPAGLINALYLAAAAMDNKNVPSEDRFAVVTPSVYWTLVNSTGGLALIDRDFGGESNGSYYDGKLLKVAGFALVKSNNAAAVLGANVAAASGQNNTYSGDFTKTQCIAFQKGAIGTVKLMDLAMETDYDIRLQGNLMVAKYAMGSGILRPECAVEIVIP